MSINNQPNHRRVILLNAITLTCVLTALATPQICIAQSDGEKEVTLQQIKNVEIKKIEQGAKAQQQIEVLDEERLGLASQYRIELKQASNLKKYNKQLVGTIRSQQDEKLLLQQQISRISNLERDIVPLMSDMLDALAEFIKLDTPFLYEERTNRVTQLRQIFNNGNVSNSEKYRRILEAYQIENDYGRTIEAYEGVLPVSGNTSAVGQTVTYLKVGRIAYVYQTMNKEQSFYWSAKDVAWKKLDNSYNTKIDEGVKMAREQIPSNLMFIPVETPKIL